jgi:GT2 family glycosyltransferase
MRVSVIVPFYNKGPYIRRCLESIAAQTFTDFEAIVVDDGSTDGGTEIAESFADTRFHLIRQPNAGPGAARNRGICEATGETLAFLDADDAWLPDYLSCSLELLRGPARDAATVSSGYIEEPGGVVSEALWRVRGLTEGIHRVTPQTRPLDLVHMLAFMSPCNTVARAEAVRRWGGFYARGAKYAEDATLWLKVLLGQPVWFHFRPLVRFHREASSLSNPFWGPRAIEPFLMDPEHVAQVCPAELRTLLTRFYAHRACKTAAVLGSWGRRREARQLLRRFLSWRDWRTPYLLSALVGCTPLGKPAGAVIRSVWLKRRHAGGRMV